MHISMIRRLSTYIAAIAVCALLAGCYDGLKDPDAPTRAGMVTITLKNSEATRSTESDNSETLIKNVVVALYPRTVNEDTPAVVLQKFDGIDKNNTTTVQMKLTDDMVQTLFNGTSGADCNLYAIANVDMSEISENATITELKNVIATSRFNELKVQESFVMAGSGTVRYTETGGVATASGNGNLIRAAAKISLNIKLPASVTDADGAEWVPAISDTGGVRAILSNGVKTSVAVPGMDWQPAEDGYYSLTMRNAGLVRELPNSGDGSEYPYHIDVPFYTYPNQWEETPEEQHKTMMTLVVPWQKRGEQQWNTYYYQVPVTNLTHIVSNYSYVVNLNVGMLGSLSPETPETLEDLTYQIVNWSNENIDVNIKDTRYLVVSPTEFNIDNEAQFSFPYYSSHPITITKVEMTYKRFNYYSDAEGNGNGEVVRFTIDDAMIEASNKKASPKVLCSWKDSQDQLKQSIVTINHPLKVWNPYNSKDEKIELTGRSENTTSDRPSEVSKSISYYLPSSPEENAYSPYEIKVTIQHTDNAAFTETVTITQYPGMYIEEKLNPGGGGDTYPGNVFVNNSDSDLGGVSELSGNNSNPNMYVITISTLESDSKYIIGDPRMPYCNNNLNTGYVTRTTGLFFPINVYGYPDLPMPTSDGGVADTWCKEAPALYSPSDSDKERRLTYYYPTIESQDNQYKMMVAPKFRVASSYGKTNQLNRDNARRRIATYQERECAAGRWRLPTYGELQFIISLSSTKKIPVLFSIGSTYWTAQGPCTVNSDGTITQVTATDYEYRNYYVRGVYDEWYWERENNYVLSPGTNGRFTYTLGDMPR